MLLLGAAYVVTACADSGEKPMFRSNSNSVSSCAEVTVTQPKGLKAPEFDIDQPGRYCLKQDLIFTSIAIDVLPSPFNAVVQGGSGGGFGGIFAAGVILDLEGHTLRSNFDNVHGVTAVGTTAHGMAKNITIKNGTFHLLTKAVYVKNTPYSVIYDRPYKILVNATYYQAAHDGYISTNLLLENLDITVADGAILLEGNDNIIRNCKIRVRGHNAITIYGANAQILDNEIIIESAVPQLSESDAPIKLRDGDGAIIAGNKITIKGPAGNKPKQAISLRSSKNVILGNNVMKGVETPFIAFDDKSSATTLEGKVLAQYLTEYNSVEAQQKRQKIAEQEEAKRQEKLDIERKAQQAQQQTKKDALHRAEQTPENQYTNAVIQAIYSEDLPAFRALLKQRGDLARANTKGQTPLAEALQYESQAPFALALIEAGIGHKEPDEWLLIAAGYSRIEVVRALLKRGAHANAKNQNNVSAIFNAAIKGKAEIVRLLIAEGADINVRTASGDTPLSAARQRGLDEIVQILERAGAR